jgi:hypothetical protein
MEKRIAISATIVGIIPGIVLAIYEVMGWKMPALVAIILIIIASLAWVIALIILCHGIWVWTRPMRKRYALQFPIYRCDKPNPLQWLVDIAEKQKHNPTTHLVIEDLIWFSFNRDEKRPFLWLRIYYRNLGVNDLVITQLEGYAYYKSEKLPDYINGGEVKNNVAAEGIGIFDVNVYIPSQFVKDVCAEIDSPTGELRDLGLHELCPKVYVDGDITHYIRWNIGQRRLIFRPNR